MLAIRGILPKRLHSAKSRSSSVVEQKEHMTRAYDIAVVVNPELSDAEIERTLHGLKAIFSKFDIQVQNEEVWGRKPTAYSLKGHGEGFYAFYQVEMPADNVLKLNQDLASQPNLIRHLVTLKDEDEIKEERE